MKTLLLLRHAKSSWEEPLDDHERPLSPRGRRAAPAMAVFMAEKGLLPDLVLHSDATRTTETWTLMAPRLGRPEVLASSGLYLASQEDLLETIRGVRDDAEKLLVIGHNPGIEVLARSLAGGGELGDLRSMRKKFPTGALAVLQIPSGRWSELAPGTALLESFVRPKDLRRGS